MLATVITVSVVGVIVTNAVKKNQNKSRRRRRGGKRVKDAALEFLESVNCNDHGDLKESMRISPLVENFAVKEKKLQQQRGIVPSDKVPTTCFVIDKSILDENISLVGSAIIHYKQSELRLDVDTIGIPHIVFYSAVHLNQQWYDHFKPGGPGSKGRDAVTSPVPLTIGLATASSKSSYQWMFRLLNSSNLSYRFTSVLQREPPRTKEDAKMVLKAVVLSEQSKQNQNSGPVRFHVTVSNRETLLLLVEAVQDFIREHEEQEELQLMVRVVAAIQPCGSPFELSIIYSLLSRVLGWIKRKCRESFSSGNRLYDAREKAARMKARNFRSPSDVLSLMSTLAEMNNTFEAQQISKGKEHMDGVQMSFEGVMLQRNDVNDVNKAKFLASTRRSALFSHPTTNAVYMSIKQIIVSTYSFLNRINPIRIIYRYWERTETSFCRKRMLEWYYFTNITWSKTRVDPFLLSEYGAEKEFLESVNTLAVQQQNGTVSVYIRKEEPQPDIFITGRHLLGEFEVDFYALEGRGVRPSLFLVHNGQMEAKQYDLELLDSSPHLSPAEDLYFYSKDFEAEATPALTEGGKETAAVSDPTPSSPASPASPVNLADAPCHVYVPVTTKQMFDTFPKVTSVHLLKSETEEECFSVNHV